MSKLLRQLETLAGAKLFKAELGRNAPWRGTDQLHPLLEELERHGDWSWPEDPAFAQNGSASAGSPELDDEVPVDFGPQALPIRFGLVSASPEMERVFRLIDKVARTELPVLITGESGTGKELVARAAAPPDSRRADRPLGRPSTAPAISETVCEESELFGHVKGAFTDAVAAKRGKLASADP